MNCFEHPWSSVLRTTRRYSLLRPRVTSSTHVASPWCMLAGGFAEKNIAVGAELCMRQLTIFKQPERRATSDRQKSALRSSRRGSLRNTYAQHCVTTWHELFFERRCDRILARVYTARQRLKGPWAQIQVRGWDVSKPKATFKLHLNIPFLLVRVTLAFSQKTSATKAVFQGGIHKKEIQQWRQVRSRPGEKNPLKICWG